MLTGFAGVGFSLAACVRFGRGAGIALTVVVTVLSATLGGDILARTPLWLLAVPAWPITANTPERLLTAGIASVLLVIIAWWLAFRSLRRRGMSR